MHLGRTIFAVLIGLSVAILPATVGFAASAGTAAELSAVQAMPDCDHHHGAADTQTPKAIHGGACMADCALTCFSFTATASSGIAVWSPVSDALKPVQVSDAVSSHMGTPPFRPPRS
jgi:hypothetical protein